MGLIRLMGMSHRQVQQGLCSVVIGLLAIGLCVALGGCAGGTVDACPYVRNENPSLLQGRTPPQTAGDSAAGVSASF